MSSDILKRVCSIQCWSPVKLTLIGYIPVKNGDEMLDLERYLHKKFSAIRDHGEWFIRPDLSQLNIVKVNSSVKVLQSGKGNIKKMQPATEDQEAGYHITETEIE